MKGSRCFCSEGRHFSLISRVRCTRLIFCTESVCLELIFHELLWTTDAVNCLCIRGIVLLSCQSYESRIRRSSHSGDSSSNTFLICKPIPSPRKKNCQWHLSNTNSKARVCNIGHEMLDHREGDYETSIQKQCQCIFHFE
jgi:hypothetical protein